MEMQSKLTRREAIALLGGGCTLIAGAASAAPFVPVRDPQCVAFAPGGGIVATGASGLSDGGFPPRPHPDVRKCGCVAIWDVATGKRLRRMETYGDLTRIAFSPDGVLLAGSRLFETTEGLALHEVRVWDVATGRVVRMLDRCHAFDFSPNGKELVVVSRTRCAAYDLADWNKERLIKPLGGCVSIGFMPDGQSLVGVCRENEGYFLRKCHASDGAELARSTPTSAPFYRVAISPDGNWLATGHDDGLVLLHNAATLETRAKLQTGERGLAHPFFAPQGNLLGAGCQENGDVVVWSLKDGKEAFRYTFEKGNFRTYLMRSPDDQHRPEKDPCRFCFSPSGEAFFVGCYGGIVRELETGRDLGRFGD